MTLGSFINAPDMHRTGMLIRQFNETVDTWITWLDDYTLEMLCRKPEAGSWSLGQMYVHIIDDTAYHIEQMKASLQDLDNQGKEMHNDAKAMFRNNRFPDMLIVGAPTNASIRQPQSKAELGQSLTAIRNEVNALHHATDLAMSGGKTEHPGLLFFDALEWLQFTEMHMRHHFRQKKRIDDRLKNMSATF